MFALTHAPVSCACARTCALRLVCLLTCCLSQIVFSSSCTVYGMAEKVPLTEDCTLHACSPYGRTKLMQEEMFQ